MVPGAGYPAPGCERGDYSMAKANRILNLVLDFLETKVCCLLFMIVCVVLMIQVIFRQIALDISWCEEVARYLNVWVIYLASSKAVKLGKHMSVDILPLILKGKAKLILFIFANIVSLIFFLVLARYGSQVLLNMTVHPQYSAANHINMIFAYAAPAVGSFMMIVRELQILVGYFKELFNKGTPNQNEVTTIPEVAE